MRRGMVIADRYELGDLLGRGGMGEVWAGRDLRLRRDVALKLLVLAGEMDAVPAARFEREAVAAAQITHPNVAGLYDSGTFEDLLFLVMEKVDGKPLGDLLREAVGSFGLDRALDIAGQVCTALAAAHGAGVVHYDIKPGNVMVASSGVVKVVDFGIAGFLHAEYSLVRTTQLGAAYTPEYAAPEQLMGETGGERSDLYALGGLVFAMLAGRPPFVAQNVWGLIGMKNGQDAPRLEEFRPDVPPDLADLVAGLLARDPGDRPGSAGEVLGRLRGLQGDESSSGFRAGSETRPTAGARSLGSAGGKPASGPGSPDFQRVYDEALRDLREAHPGRDDYVIVTAAVRAGDRAGWSQAPASLLRSLPAYAVGAGMIGDLLANDSYLLYADIPALLEQADEVSTVSGGNRIRLLQLTPEAATAPPAERAAMFSVTEALNNLGFSYQETTWREMPYRARWSVARQPDPEPAVVPQPDPAPAKERDSRISFGAMCAVPAADGRSMVAMAARGGPDLEDPTVRLWDPEAGSYSWITEGAWKYYHSPVVLITVTSARGTFLVSGGSDGIQLWDSGNGRLVERLTRAYARDLCEIRVAGHDSRWRDFLAQAGFHEISLWDLGAGKEVCRKRVGNTRINAVCAVREGSRSFLISGDDDGAVRMLEPRAISSRRFKFTEDRVLTTHQSPVMSLWSFEAGGRAMVISRDNYGELRLWDVAGGRLVRAWYEEKVSRICDTITVGGRVILAFVGENHIWLRDPETGDLLGERKAHGVPESVCPIDINGRSVLAVGGFRVEQPELWECEASGEISPFPKDKDAGQGQVRETCLIPVGEQALLAVGEDNGMIRLRNPVTGEQVRSWRAIERSVWTLCSVPVDGRVLLATGGYDDGRDLVRLWDPSTGDKVRSWGRDGDWHTSWLCAVTVDGRTLLAASHVSGNRDSGFVELRDSATGRLVRELETGGKAVEGICSVNMEDRVLIAGGFSDGQVRLWDAASGRQVSTLVGEQELVPTCAVSGGGHTLLATLGEDGATRLWDPGTGQVVRVLEKGVAGYAVTVENRTLLVGLGVEGEDLDETVRLWDPLTGASVLTIPVHREVCSLTPDNDRLYVGFAEGIIAIDLNTG